MYFLKHFVPTINAELKQLLVWKDIFPCNFNTVSCAGVTENVMWLVESFLYDNDAKRENVHRPVRAQRLINIFELNRSSWMVIKVQAALVVALTFLEIISLKTTIKIKIRMKNQSCQKRNLLNMTCLYW